MAVIRCPSCGKPNPDFLDICQYCDTPLHGPAAPGAAAAAPGESQPAAPAGGETEPDIFAKLRSTPSAADEEPEAQPIAEIPDWLSRLGGPEGGPQGGAEAAPAQPAEQGGDSAGKVSSWLDSLRSDEPEGKADSRDWYWTGTQGESEPAAPKAAVAPSPAEELPEWLRSIDDTAAPAQAAPAIDETAGLPDWLQGVNAATTAQPEAPQPAQPAAAHSPFAAEPAEGLPDWLQAGFGTAAPAEPAPAQPAAAPSPFAVGPAEELPDWLQDFGAAVPATAALAPAQPTAAPSPFAAEPAEELPDWLQGGLGVAVPATAAPAPAQPASAPSPFAATPAEELPDWLQDFGAAAPAQPAAAPSPFAAEPAEELPDWLQSVGATAPQPTAAAPAASPFAAEPQETAGPLAETPAISDELPDWLRTVASGAPAPGAEPALGEAPDWLQSFDAAIPPEQTQLAPLATEPAEAVPTPEEELPEWLRSVGTGMQAANMPPAEARPTAWLGTPGAVQGGPAVITPDTSAEEQPEWLRELGVSPASPEVAAPAVATPGDEQPEWLRSLGVTTPLAGQPAGMPPLEPTADTEQPEWLRGLDTAATIPAGKAPSGPVSPFGAGEAPLPETPAGRLPDWLANLSPAKSGAAAGESQPSAISGVRLAPVALPSWLEAMRPVEVQRPTITPEVDDYEETVGVLAGLRGVLRAQPAVTQPGKSATKVHKLEVSDAQTKQANLLVRTLAEATQAHPASKRSFWLALPVARLAVFAALFLALVIPITFPAARGYFEPSQSWNPAAQSAFTLLDNLSPAQPALIAFDYDPAQAGELDPLAQALISHLKRRSVPVVGISTSPAGAATGELLLNQIYDSSAYGSQYVNLGYLPGGPVGMLQMTNGLRPLFGVDYRGDRGVWKTDVLTQTRQLSDFGVIVLVSATPDTVRAWVEQLASYPSKPGIIAAVSAGAEPLVRPYYDADPANTQLKGLVTGILGAAQYERQSGVAGLASGLMWDVLGWGLLVVIVLLIGGNLFYGLAGVMRRQKR